MASSHNTTFVYMMNLPYCLSMGHTIVTLEQQQLWFLVLQSALKSLLSHVIPNIIPAEELKGEMLQVFTGFGFFFLWRKVSFLFLALVGLEFLFHGPWGDDLCSAYCLPSLWSAIINISRLHLWASERLMSLFCLFLLNCFSMTVKTLF